MDYRMKRNIGIITILVGVGLFFISIIFSTDYYGNTPSGSLSFIGGIPIRYIVLKEGEYIEGGYAFGPGHYIRNVSIPVFKEGEWVERKVDIPVDREYIPAHYKGRIAIPLKYLLSLSIVLILVGTGIVLLSKNKETNG